jgi:hypothetical protein
MRGEAAVNDAEFVLVVANAKFDVSGLALGRVRKVRLGAEQSAVPIFGGLDIVGEGIDSCDSAKHGACPLVAWF